ncbi:cation diffusion facilitator family transporter [Aestuariivirga litoralis]|uniref:cation diffusion facilitator family transporter n=1 Tax=Aestuariivirga litoralis TaxID=2650924 RepID=UPI0018C759B8|nr:cation diffusion facilitator family transporter [Aestuariivirga litoralis]MBG1232168.1 cation transporter [Aestuariivirga litoralis]
MNDKPKFELVNPKPQKHEHGFHDHEQLHDHGHDHDHGALGHSHAPDTFGWVFAIGIGLNTAFVLGEGLVGVLVNSTALLADAGHNMFDVLGLFAAWFATLLAKRAPTARYTFGMKGSTILAALFNGVFLLVAVGAIAWEAVIRLMNPVEVPGAWVMITAGIGILINGGTALLFMRGSKNDINIRGAYLHMAADAGVSAGVVISGLLMIQFGWRWLDPVTSLFIVAVIIWSSWNLLREALALSMSAVPSSVDAASVRKFLTQQKGVSNVHDLHIWATSTTDVALTAHLMMPAGHPGDKFLAMICDELAHHYNIGHATLQIETGPEACASHCDAAA